MPEQKTKPHTGDVGEFLAQVEDPVKRADSHELVELMTDVSGELPVLWGNMIGFGHYHYKYASGHEGDAFLVGFAPRKAEFSIYLMGAPEGEARREALLARLGKHRMGKGCLYVKRLSDIDMGVLRELAEISVSTLREPIPRNRKGRSDKSLRPWGTSANRTVEGLGDKRPTRRSSLTGCMGRLRRQ